jgi:signal peptide peptidase SppA
MMRLIDVVTAPWAMEPAKFQEMLSIYQTHLKGEKIDVAGLQARMGGALPGPTQGYQVRDGVALLPIDGMLANKMNLMMDISGGTSYQTLRRDFRAALADPAAHSIMLMIDSPGGNTMGLQELAAEILAGRDVKPIVAFTDSIMASAAYWLGSCASEIYISSDMTMVGSIGVIAVHRDMSEANAKAGIKVSEIYAGKYKNQGTPNAPLGDEARAEMQSRVDRLYSLFVDAVAAHRGVDAATVIDQMADGRAFLGRDAVTAGLVDGVSTMDALIRDMNAGAKPAKRYRMAAGVAAAASAAGPAIDAAVELGGVTAPAVAVLSIPHEEPAMITKDFLKANHAALLQEVVAEALAAASPQIVADAAAAERTRIMGVLGVALPGHEALVNGLAFDGKTTPAEAALKVNEAERAKRGAALSALQTGAAATAAVAASAAAAGAGEAEAAARRASEAQLAALPPEERAKKEWDADPKIRTEFAGKEAQFIAYRVAELNGQVRFLRKTA